MNFLDYLTQFFNEFGSYTIQFYDHFLGKLLIYPILVTLIAIYVFAIILSKLKLISISKNATFRVYKSYFISSLLVSTIILCLAIYAWVIDFKGHFDISFRLTFLLSQIVAFTFLIVKYLKLSSFFKRESLKNILIQPTTHVTESNKSLTLKKSFEKFKWWLLLPILSFLFLFLLQEKYTLVSIVIDASGSMEDGRLTTGKQGLIKAFEKVNLETTDFIISVTPRQVGDDCNNYTSFSNILKEKNPNNFCTERPQIFQNNSPISFINNIEVNSDRDRGYILFSMWQNYLISKEVEEDKQGKYNKKIMLVASDFLEEYDERIKGYLPSFYDSNICDDEYEFSDFYDENAFLINLEQERGTFVNIYEECYPNTIYDGYDTETYVSAIEEIFDNLKSKTWYFIIWLVVFYIIFSISILLISPKKLNSI